jgi:hypothetical protein
VVDATWSGSLCQSRDSAVLEGRPVAATARVAEGLGGGDVVVATPVADVEWLLSRGAGALAADGDLQASRRWFDWAYRVAEQADDTDAMAVAVVGLGGLWVHEQRMSGASTLLPARLRHVLSLIDPRSSLALRLRVRLAAETDYRSGGHAAILAVLDEARRAADPAVRAQALSLAHHCLLGPDHGELRRSLAVELIGESTRTAERSDLLIGLLWQTVDLFLDAEPHAERRLGELRDLLTHGDHLAIGFVVDAIEVMLTIRAGRFEQAEALADACAQRGTAAGDIDVTGWHGAQLVAIRWYQGRLVELLPMLTELAHSPTLSVVDNSYFAALAVAAAMAGDRRQAAGALARLRGRDLAELPRSSTWLVTMNGIVEAAHRLDDADTSARAYQLLRPFAELPMVASLGVACFGSVHQALGVASLTTGDLDQATEHLRTAVDRNLALAHWPAVLTSRQRYAQALALRGQPGDAATAHHESAVAAEEAAALGLAPPGDGHHEPPQVAAVCTRQGRRWRLDLGRRSVLVDHSVGMLHLAVLVANPGTEIPAVELVTGVAVLGTPTAVSAQPMLDQLATGQYRRRLAELSADIEDLESRSDGDGAARARAERDWLIAELAGATGISGRSRRFPDNAERARITVGKAIRRALTRVCDTDAVIGTHLRSSVHTGMRCSYRPA